MKKLFSVALAALLLAIAIVPASAMPPDPAYYSVIDGGLCWLPNGEALPTRVAAAKQALEWPAPLHLTAACLGQLPKGAARPKEAITLTYVDTGYVCEVQVGRQAYITVDYDAIVYPDGATEITCRVDLQ